MRTVAYIVLILSIALKASAQDMAPDTTLTLRDVNIVSSRIGKFAKGQGVEMPDSLTRAALPSATLAELLPGFTSSYIRNYGAGTLSTLSFRGTSANHTSVLWNGIRLAPPNIGYIDLSLIQGSFFSDISVLHGGASPMFGSGAVGASLHIDNKPVFSRKGLDLGLALSAGSFGSVSSELNSVFKSNKFWSRTSAAYSGVKNDFYYQDINGDRSTMQHAEILRSGFLQDVAWLLPGDQYIMASAWFQYAERTIPPTMTEDTSAAEQMDRSWRTMLLWKDLNEKSAFEAKFAYFNEFTRYTDPVPDIYSVIRSQSVTGSFEGTWEVAENTSLFTGIQSVYEYADLDYYSKPEDQGNLALYASLNQKIPLINWQASLNCRQEFFTGYNSPFLFSVGAEGKIWGILSGNFSVSRNFRSPTLNERFWVPGGNPDLKPESSWNEEAGLSIQKIFNGFSTKLALTAYNSRVNNWILWLPVTSSYWAVENSQEVWSRGIEVRLDQSFTFNKTTALVTGSYTLSKSTNEVKLSDLDGSYKKQLIYTPKHRFMVRTGAVYRGFYFSLAGNFTGVVYTTKDNSSSLPSYFLLDAVFSKAFKIKQSIPLTIQCNINNILNKDYQVTPYRPMPGISFMITVKAGINIEPQAASHKLQASGNTDMLSLSYKSKSISQIQIINPKP